MKSNKTWMANEAYQWLEWKDTLIATGIHVLHDQKDVLLPYIKGAQWKEELNRSAFFLMLELRISIGNPLN